MGGLPVEHSNLAATASPASEPVCRPMEPVLMVAACPFPCRRGTPIRIERLAETIARSGREVHVVAYHYSGENDGAPFSDNPDAGPAYKLHRIANVPGTWDPAPGPGLGKMLLLNPLLFAKTLKVVRKHNIRLLHCHHYEALLVGLAVRRFRPVSIVYDAHTLLGDELSYYAAPIFEGTLNRFGSLLDRVLPKRADHIIPVTEEIHDKLAATKVAAPMTIVGNGLEEAAIDWFRRQTGAVIAGRVVYAGNLAAYQGIDLLLDAFARVAETHAHARLVLVIPQPHEAVLEQARARGIGDRVTAVDADRAELAHELCTADVLVNPRIECPGYPLKLLNYMAAERPIVSFKSSGKNLKDGIDACIVPDGDVAAFAEAISRLLGDRARGDTLGQTARDTVFNHYSWEAIAQRVHTAYDQACAARGIGERDNADG
ncbi:hypothetical protein CVM52_03155 [Pseudooceanicola lipolyticus]|uniref:Glycosyltransferase subfamily 4-like N-terminal domain-containing protein n=2 Tax=Pseudooceanicola lipolyticus TaxID=2029104 RepID=A0A2M8J5U9_9RHOB|nr:hypothetical protein CVM52_03155 [Pseudooceanicola lipolyticus]